VYTVFIEVAAGIAR